MNSLLGFGNNSTDPPESGDVTLAFDDDQNFPAHKLFIFCGVGAVL